MGRLIFALTVALIVGITLAFDVYGEHARQSRRLSTYTERYTPWGGYIMTTFACVRYAAQLCIALRSEAPLDALMSQAMPMLLLGGYFCLLACLLPLLRKLFSARGCAFLWLAPLSVFGLLLRGNSATDMPMWILPVPVVISDQLLRVLLWIWLAGAVLTLAWKILEHHLFRKRIFKTAHSPGASPAPDILLQEAEQAHIWEVPCPIWICPSVKTPLSIGLGKDSTCIVLPKKDYSKEELSLLLRHELIHLCRKDNWVKLIMTFFTAVFWWNPLMWIAIRRCADDLELSCDETVLLGCSPETRKQYAALLLNTAADQRGFTTCLSGSFRALRYRLRSVVTPKKRLAGGVAVGLITMLLVAACMTGTVSYHPGTAGQRLFRGEDPQTLQLRDVMVTENGETVTCNPGDEAELMAYLTQLPVERLAGKFDFRDEPYAQIAVEASEARYTLIINEAYIRAIIADRNDYTEACYRLREPLDWQQLRSLLKES